MSSRSIKRGDKLAVPACSTSDTTRWHCMYLGSFVVMLITNAEVAKDLAELTRSDFECIEAIGRMRDGKAGDRVYPVLEWLRAQRAASPDAVVTVFGDPDSRLIDGARADRVCYVARPR